MPMLPLLRPELPHHGSSEVGVPTVYCDAHIIYMYIYICGSARRGDIFSCLMPKGGWYSVGTVMRR